MGYFADMSGIALAFFIPAICYLYIVYYGIKGHEERAAVGEKAAVDGVA